MAIKDILVYVDNDETCENRILTAVNLCSHFDARLSGLYLNRRMMVPAYPGADFSVAVYDAIEKHANELRKEAESRFAEALKNTGTKNEFCAIDGDVTDSLLVHSRYADLVILPRQQTEQSNQNIHFLVEPVLLGSACPVLVLAEDNPVTLPPQRAMLAWDSSREASRALRAALPMLAQVNKLDVVSVGPNEAEAIDITHYITRHGINAQTHLLDYDQGSVGQVLLEQAMRLDSQLLVMGAYGHSRFLELVLGGTTRFVLEHTSLPVLYSH